MIPLLARAAGRWEILGNVTHAGGRSERVRDKIEVFYGVGENAKRGREAGEADTEGSVGSDGRPRGREYSGSLVALTLP